MAFPQDQVAWLLANGGKIQRYLFIPQFLAAALFLSFAYVTGHVHAHLLFKGAQTHGEIVSLKPVQMAHRSSTGSTNWYTTIYEPLVEFNAGDRVVRFQEWKGSASSAGIGSSVPVIYDPADPSFAMLDHGFSNWLPWAPCFLIGLILALASLKGFLAFFFASHRSPAVSRA
jgi:Protein of unknown function (DUF3592)